MKVYTIDEKKFKRIVELDGQFRPLFNDVRALIDEIRRQGKKQHVMDDEELSFFLGMIAAYIERMKLVS